MTKSFRFEEVLVRVHTNMLQKSGAEIVLPESWPMAQGYAPLIEEVWEFPQQWH